MSPLLGFLAVTAAITFGSVFLWNRILRRPPWIDAPRRDRHSQRAVPRTGGPAWLTGWLSGLALISLATEWLFWDRSTVTAALAVFGAFLLGYIDDKGWIRSGWKGRLQAGLLAVFVFSGVWGTALDLQAAAVFLFVFALHLALQIFDNMDGALGTVSACGLAVVGVLAPESGIRVLAWCGAAAAVGFLVLNRPPARVFFGNAGSQAVSLLAAGLVGRSLLRESSGGLETWAVVLPWLWPLFDLVFVCVRRVRAGRAPWMGGRDHTTHALARFLGRDEAVFALLIGTSVVLGWLALRLGGEVGAGASASAALMGL